ncbi:MAG TPA: hypothetical protein VFQ88_13450 [Nevskiaceae bacterium]|nr:hypothetical protein [Nevskiaceae bacterium]
MWGNRTSLRHRSTVSWEIVAVLAVLLSACGGGGGGNGGNVLPTYTGQTAAVTAVNSSDAQSVGTAVAETARYGKEVGNADGLFQKLAIASINALQSDPSDEQGANYTAHGDCGGTAQISATNRTNTSADFSATFNKIFVTDTQSGDQLIINGAMRGSATARLDSNGDVSSVTLKANYSGVTLVDRANGDSAKFEGGVVVTESNVGQPTQQLDIAGKNVQVVHGADTFAINDKVTCTGSPRVCTSTAVFASSSTPATIYRIDNPSLQEDPSTPGNYTMSGVLFDPDNGSIVMKTIVPLTFCANGYPQGGTVEIDSAKDRSKLGTVEFSGCAPTSVTVTDTNGTQVPPFEIPATN